MARYYTSQEYNPISQYAPAHLDYINQSGEELQKKQDIAQAVLTSLDKPFGYINTPQESALAQQTKKEIDDKVNNLSNLDINNPNDKKKLYQGIKEVRAYYEPGGQAYSHEANLEAYKEHVKGLDDALKKKPEEGGINLDQYNYLKAKSLNDFSTTGRVTNGQYNEYKGEMPALNPDIDKQVIEATKDWKENAVSKGYWTDKSGKQWAIKNSSDLEYIDPNEVKQSVLADIMTRPENQAYARQQSEVATYGKNFKTQSGGSSGYDSNGNEVEYAPGNEDHAINSIKNKTYNDIFEKPANLAAARLGFQKTKNDQDIKENPFELQKEKQKIEHPKFTISNESALTPGEKVDYSKISNNIINLKQQLSSLPKEGEINDNWETKTQRETLQKQLTIANNYLNTASEKYYNTKEGLQELTNQYNKGIHNTDLLNNKTGIGLVLNDPEVKKYIKNSNDYVEFMKGNLQIPEDIINKKFVNAIPSLGGAMPAKSTMSLRDYLNQDMNKSVSNYIEKNPISYSSDVLTSPEPSSVVGLANKALTDRVNENGTNYYTSDGLDLNTWKSKNLDEKDKTSVAVLSKPINGQYANYMTVKDKDGIIKYEMPIFPKEGGAEEQGHIGTQLMEENKAKSDPLEVSNYKKGEEMLAQSKYGESLNDQYLKSFEKKARNNSGTYISTPKITIPTPIGTIEGIVKIKKESGITYFQLVNTSGKPITSPEKSIDDLRVSLLEIQ